MAQFGNPFQIVWNVLVEALILIVVIATATTPAATFRHGRRTKIFWMLAALGLFVTFAGYTMPIGAVWTLNPVMDARARGKSSRSRGASTPTSIIGS